jgi:hypothetical protein
MPFSNSFKMKTNSFNKELLSPKGNEITDVRSFRRDLPLLIKRIKAEKVWREGEISTRTLLESPDKRIVLTALHKGSEIESYQANNSILLQILGGKLRFYSVKGIAILDKGQSLAFYENVNYKLIALEESVFLLTVLTDKIERIEKDVTFCVYNTLEMSKIRRHQNEFRHRNQFGSIKSFKTSQAE